MALQIRRGVEAERTAGGGVVFAEGELIYVTDTDALYVGDGSTPGGVKLTDSAGATLGTYITADTINSTLDLQQNLDLNGNDIIGTGNININGTITATGNINIGDDADADTVDFTAKITSSLTPSADSTHNIGAMNARWNNGYFTGLWVDGQVNAVAVNGNVIANDSTVMVDAGANTFTGDLTGDVTGDTTGTHTGAVVGDVTGNVTGNTTGSHTGDVKGSVFGDDSTPIIDAVNNTLAGNLTGDVTGNVTGDVVGNIKGTISNDPVIETLQGPADAIINAFNITATGTITGDVVGDVTGNVTGNVTGSVTGDVKGSVFGDDSAVLVDAVNNNIPGSVISGTVTADLVGNVTGDVTGNVTGDVTGNVLTNNITSADSSAITVVPSVEFDSDIRVDQDIRVGVGTAGLTETIITPTKFSNYNGTNQDGAIYTKKIGTDENDNSAFPLTFDTQTETIKVATFYEGIQIIGDQATSAITLISQEQAGDVSAIKFNVYTGVVGDGDQEEDPANFTDKTVISTEVADFGTPVKFPNLTQTEVNALNNEVGMVVFNTTNAKLEVCTGAGTGGAQTYVALH